MNSFKELFKIKQKELVSVYFTAGYPRLDSTGKIILSLIENGVDIIEIGMPYSDPLADGPVIQNSSVAALKNGISIQTIFDQLQEIQPRLKEMRPVPLVLMGYLNPVLQYGFERFCENAAAAGVSGLILPDLPMREYEEEYRSIVEGHGLNFIFLVTPETSEERIRKMDDLSNGFIYAVSSSAITGSDTDFSAQEAYFQRLKDMRLKNKILVGFGIRDARTFQKACEHTAGAIIGTAFIRALEGATDEESAVKSFLNGILEGRAPENAKFVSG